MAVTLLASTLVRSAAAAGAIGLGVFVALSLVGALPVVNAYVPPALLTWATHLTVGEGGYTAWRALMITLVAIAACLAATWAVFRRQEL